MTKRLRIRIAKMKIKELLETGKILTSQNTATAIKSLINNSDIIATFKQINDTVIIESNM